MNFSIYLFVKLIIVHYLEPLLGKEIVHLRNFRLCTINKEGQQDLPKRDGDGGQKYWS